jgi:hypothetical protein
MHQLLRNFSAILHQTPTQLMHRICLRFMFLLNEQPRQFKGQSLVRISTAPVNSKLGLLTFFAPDMNDPFTLDLYTQLIIFKQNLAQSEFGFFNADHLMQDILHSLARKLGLEYEYSLHTKHVKISKNSASLSSEPSAIHIPDFHYKSLDSSIVQLPDTSPNEISLSTYETQFGHLSSSGIHADETTSDMGRKYHFTVEGQSLDISDINLGAQLYSTSADLDPFNLARRASEAQGVDYGSQLVATDQALEASINWTSTQFAIEAPDVGGSPMHLGPNGMEDGIALGLQSTAINLNETPKAHHKGLRARSNNQTQMLIRATDRQDDQDNTLTRGSWKSKLTDSKSYEPPLDLMDHEFTFIMDPSATSQKPSTTIRKYQKNVRGEGSSAIKFAACWKCKSLRKRVSKQNISNICTHITDLHSAILKFHALAVSKENKTRSGKSWVAAVDLSNPSCLVLFFARLATQPGIKPYYCRTPAIFLLL